MVVLPSAGDVWVSDSEFRLTQVITNLLDNAAKHCDRPATIEVGVSVRNETQVQIDVRDDGPGIPADLMPRIFEPFIHGEELNGRSRAGLGLGLAIVKGLVELHDGRIDAQSPGAGAGTSFIVTLSLLSPGGA